MKYLANHNCILENEERERAFSGTFTPLLIASMQFFGAVLTETINIMSICALENTKEVIMNFIALGVIAEIDNYYLSALPPSLLKDRLKEPFEIKTRSREINFTSRDLKSKLVRLIYRAYRIIEVAFYYYFTPFSVVFITYLVGGNNNNNSDSAIEINTPPIPTHQNVINCTLAS
jgi:hypothetical protein